MSMKFIQWIFLKLGALVLMSLAQVANRVHTL